MSTFKFGFVLEQTLGHVTHSKNLLANTAKDSSIEIKLAPIAFEATGLSARIPLYKSNWTVRAGLRARWAVSQMQRNSPVDALFVHTQVPAVLMTNWVKRIPTIVSLDATPLQYDQLGEHYAHQKGNPRLEELKWRANRSCFHHARRLVTWSNWAKQGLIDEYEIPADKIVVIPPGVNLDEWRSRPEERGNDGPLKILFVGGNLQRKGGLDLIEAFRALRARYEANSDSPKIELHLATKDLLPHEPGIFIYNHMEPNSEALKELFRQSHIFCLPTYGDCLPMVLSEAGSVGLPLISTDVAAIPEIVKEGESGLLIKPGDVSALVNALANLIENPSLRVDLGQNAAALVRREFDGEQNAFRLLDLLKEIAVDVPGHMSELNHSLPSTTIV